MSDNNSQLARLSVMPHALPPSDTLRSRKDIARTDRFEPGVLVVRQAGTRSIAPCPLNVQYLERSRISTYEIVIRLHPAFNIPIKSLDLKIILEVPAGFIPAILESLNADALFPFICPKTHDCACRFVILSISRSTVGCLMPPVGFPLPHSPGHVSHEHHGPTFFRCSICRPCNGECSF